MKNPATILDTWKRVVKKQEDGRKTTELPKKDLEQKTKIRRGLTELKKRGAEDLTKTGPADKFVELRDRVAVVMRKFCRYVKTSKDLKSEDKKLHAKFLKQIKQLTVLVENLDPATIDPTEAEGNLDALDKIDTQELDSKLEQPDTEPEVELETAEEADESGDVPPLPPGSSPEELTWQTRRKTVEGQLLTALKTRRADATQLQQAYTEAKGQAQQRQFTDALAALDTLENMLAAPPSSNGAANESVAFENRLKQVLARVLEAAKLDPTQGKEFNLRVKEAMTYGRKQDYPQANDVLDTLEKALAGGNGTATDPVAEAQSLLEARLKALDPSYQEASVALPQQQATLDKIKHLATTSARAGNVKKTGAVLDQFEAAIQLVLRTAPKPQGEPQPPPEPGEKVDPQTRFRKRLNKLNKDFQQALATSRDTNPERYAELLQLFRTAMAKDKESQFEEGLETLDALESLVTGTLRSTKAAEEIEEGAGKNLVNLVQAKLVWQRARQDAAAAVKAYLDDVFNDPDLINDPRFPEIKNNVSKAATALSAFDVGLEAALDEVATKPETRAEAVKKTLALIGACNAELSKNMMIEAIDDGTYGPGNVGKTLKKAIDLVAAELASCLPLAA